VMASANLTVFWASVRSLRRVRQVLEQLPFTTLQIAI
jgi:hypothetical protein